MADFDEAIMLEPDDPIKRLLRLMLYKELGEMELALADLNHVIETSPEIASRESTKRMIIELQETL